MMICRSVTSRLFNQLSLIDLNLNRFIATQCQNVNKFTERSHTCGELTQDDIGKRVNLYGWVKYTRFDNKIVALRDSYGTIQCIADVNKMLKSYRKMVIHNESVIKVSGLVRARPEKQINNDMQTGTIEVVIDNLEILNNASKDLPILARDNDPDATLANRLKFRYLDLRNRKMQEALRFRSKVCSILRRKLLDLNFVECETPTLFRRTPGGANEFIVPTQTSGMFYGLTQSPQQLKQLLMVGGTDRYFQICRCYRDESGRTDRQPEFTQLDIELSFTNQYLVMALINELMLELLTNMNRAADLDLSLSDIFDTNHQIKTIKYSESIKRYGCDKPDTRFEWLIEESADKREVYIEIPFHIDCGMISRLLKVIQSGKNLDTSKLVPVVKLASNGATRICVGSTCELARKILGQLRIMIASELELNGEQVYRSKFKFIWVTDFPLFESDGDNQTITSSHHPFTAPTTETAHHLETDPRLVVGQHYDLVLNGQEVAGGSIRIHDSDMQRFIFKNILNLDDNTFEYFIEALRAGCPPHGGIAIGLDRLIAILLERGSIRDVIAFPKSNVGRDLMSSCPHAIDPNIKKMYHISN